jgi:TetR/AcrR family transcriptional regulator of autoinduction and epiphytic fitness
VGETDVTDGRVVRANRTRDNVVDALLELIDEGNLRPTAREIAERANVSLRSVYVHFDDVEQLFQAAALRHYERLEVVRCAGPIEGTLEERIVTFVDRRARLYEVGRNVTQAALLQEPFSPAMRSILDQARRAGWAELDKVFGKDLKGRARSRQRAALDMLTQPGAWRLLREHHRMSIEEAKAVICDQMRAHLGVERPDREAATEKTKTQAGS